MNTFAAWNRGLEAPLARTLEYVCKSIPYYRETLEPCAVEDVWQHLPQLPLLLKSAAIDNVSELRAKPIVRPGRVSTGTLRKGRRFLDVQHTDEEARAITQFEQSGQNWSAVLAPDAWKDQVLEPSSGSHPTRILEVLSLHHELPTPTREPGVLQIGWHAHPNCLEMIAEILAPGRFPDLSLVRIVPGPLAKLTYLLQKRAFDFAASPVRCLTLYGYVTPRWRAAFENTWQAETYEVFSMSELRSVAVPCPHAPSDAPHFHFEELPIVTEVLDPVRLTPISEGIGHLVLTTLYPLVQQQPFIRYLTGDLVRIHACDKDSRLGFLWQGRTDRVAVWDETAAHQSILTERDVLETIDGYPMVARSRDDFEMLGHIPENTMGWPIFEILVTPGENTPTLVCIRVALRYVPALYPEYSATLKYSMAAQLLRTSPELQRGVNLGHVKLEVELIGPDDSDILSRHGLNQLFYPTPQTIGGVRSATP